MNEKDIIAVKGYVKVFCRERGKLVPGTLREGYNVCTLTGKQYFAEIQAYAFPAMTPVREDRILYLGVGDGAQPEVPSITRLVNPVAYTAGLFLKALSASDYPFVPPTSVVHKVVFGETEISIGAPVFISELGLFTDGDELNHTPGARSLVIGDAMAQKPLFYKNIEPLGKTTNFELEVHWEIRFL